MKTKLNVTVYDLVCGAGRKVLAGRTRLAAIARGAERGDADSAGSTLRTVFVVAVVALVLTTLGPAILQAAADASATLRTRP